MFNPTPKTIYTGLKCINICILYIYIYIYHDEIKSGNSIVSLNNVDMMICKSTNIVIIVVSLFVRVTAGLL